MVDAFDSVKTYIIYNYHSKLPTEGCTLGGNDL